MPQGDELAVIARNIRQIVVRGSKTDPPTVSGAKGDRRT